MNDHNRQKSNKLSVSAKLKSPSNHISTQNKHNSNGAVKHQEPMERKKPLPIKELKEELKQ